MFKKSHTLASFLFTLLLYTGAHAQQTAAVTEPQIWRATIEEDQSNPAYGIPFLSLSNQQLQIEGGENLHFTRISGRFHKKIIEATFNSKEIALKDDASFDLPFGFPLDAKTFTITAIDQKQKLFRAIYKIVPIDLDVKSSTPPPAPSALPTTKRMRYSAGLGLTSLSFRQRNVTSFSQMAATVKASGSYRLVPDQYDLGVSAFFNLIPFSSNSPAGYKIQYLGINARIGRPIIKAPSKIRLNLNAGIYYNTSLSSIGFTNMIGPQLYPEAIYLFNNGNSLLAYAKYSPALSNSFSISFRENREMAMGFHYSFQFLQKHRVAVGFDLSQLNLNTNNDWASTNTYSLSAGYSF